MKNRLFLIVVIMYSLSACAVNNKTPSIAEINSTTIQVLYEEARSAVEEKLNVDLKHVKFSIAKKGSMRNYFHDSAKDFAKVHFDEKFHSEIIASSVRDSMSRNIALYDRRTKSILVTEENFKSYLTPLVQSGYSIRQAALPVLFHESVHAADDVRLDFKKLRKATKGSQLGFSAVIEGHAQFVSRQLCKDAGCADAFEQASEIFMSSDIHTHKSTLFDAGSDNTELKYLHGERFLTSIYARGGEGLMQKALVNPPGNLVQIYNPDFFPDSRREQESETLRVALQALTNKTQYENWVYFSDNTVSGDTFSRKTNIRTNQVEAWVNEIAGSAKAEFYDQSLDELTPVRITLYRMKLKDAAVDYAVKRYQSAYINSASVIGSGLKLKNLKIPDNKAMMGSAERHVEFARSLQAEVVDIEDETVTPYFKTVISLGDVVCEIMTFRPQPSHRRIINSVHEIMVDLTSDNRYESNMASIE